MPEPKILIYSFKEITETLIKKQGIHEGHWCIYVKFGIQGGNVSLLGGPDPIPTALVPILELGIQRRNESDSMTVDASKVNPPARKTVKPKKKKVA